MSAVPPSPPGAPMQYAHTRARAGFGSRLGGYLLDGLLYGLLLGVFIGAGIGMIIVASKDCLDKVDAANWPAGDTSTVTCTTDEVNGGLLSLGVLVITVGIMVVLYLYCRALGRTGQTWGRKIVGISVVDKFTEQPIGFGRALGRTVFAGLVSGAFCDLGYLWMLWDADQQTWHDKVVGSVVVQG